VNLIGEHTDYNDGFALPIAIAAGCTTRVRIVDDGRLRISSVQRSEPVSVPLAELAPGTVPDWAGYVAGIVWILGGRGLSLPGLEIAIDGDVPLGAGLSSSAALSCSSAAAVDDVLGLELGPAGWVALARHAENDFVGAATGGMDQLASVYSRAGQALLCDLQSLTTAGVPFDPGRAGLALVVINTNAPHHHRDGEYGERRASCEQAARLLGVDSLRAVQSRDHAGVLDDLRAAADLAGVGPDDDARLVRRTRHVLSENARVLAVADKLRANAVPEIADELNASHASMRDDFEITVPVVDLAVAAALDAGALGARMTGGGFGGCVIALTPVELAARVAQQARATLVAAGNAAPDWFVVQPSAGTRRV
jgi:galactokinase